MRSLQSFKFKDELVRLGRSLAYGMDAGAGDSKNGSLQDGAIPTNSGAVMLLHALALRVDRISAATNTFVGWNKKRNAGKKMD
jgi:hypothetical protein